MSSPAGQELRTQKTGRVIFLSNSLEQLHIWEELYPVSM